MINTQQYRRSSIIILQKRTFCNTYKNEMDKHKKEEDKIYDTSSQASNEAGKSKQVQTQVDEGEEKGKGAISDDSVNSSGDSNNSIFDQMIQRAVFNSRRDRGVPNNNQENAGPSNWHGGAVSSHLSSPASSERITYVRQARDDREKKERVCGKLRNNEDVRSELSMGERSSITVSNSGIGRRSSYSSVHITKARSEKNKLLSERSYYDREKLNLEAEKKLKLPTQWTEEYLDGNYLSTRTNAEMRVIILNWLRDNPDAFGGPEDIALPDSPNPESISDTNSEDSDLRKAILLSKKSSGGGPPSGGSGTGGYDGPSGSGTVHFILESLDELTVIIPCLLGITSTILAINPEIFMYFRLIITLIREPAFKLYMYFKYLDILCSIKEINNISSLFFYLLFGLVRTIFYLLFGLVHAIFYFLYFPFRNLTTLFW